MVTEEKLGVNLLSSRRIPIKHLKRKSMLAHCLSTVFVDLVFL